MLCSATGYVRASVETPATRPERATLRWHRLLAAGRV
jgi:hypothetical protein